MQLTAKFLATVLQFPEIPIHGSIFHSPLTIKNHSFRHHLENSLDRTFKFHCLTLPYTPPWLFTPPKRTLTLTQFLKNSTSTPIYRSHLQEIISSFSNPTLCFTIGSKSKYRVGFAFSVGGTPSPKPQHLLIPQNHKSFLVVSNPLTLPLPVPS